MPPNKSFAVFGKKDDCLFNPEGMSGFVQSTPPDWTKKVVLSDLCVSNERSEWAVNHKLSALSLDP